MKKNETNNEINNLLATFDDKNIDQEVEAINMRDPSIKTRTELFQFFSTRLAGLSKREEFKDKIQAALEEHIDKGEVSFSQLLSLYKTVFSESSLASESVLSLLRPSSNVPNPLLTAMDTRKTVDDFDNIHQELDTKSIKAIDTLYRALKKYETSDDTKED